MARVKRALNAQKKRRTVLKASKGYRGQRSRLYRKAKEQQLHSLTYAYRDRKARKGDFRKLWISRINAAARANGITYNRLIQGLKAAGVEVDRKNLAEIAVSDPAAFTALVEVAKAALPEDVNAPSGRGRLSLHDDRTDRTFGPRGCGGKLLRHVGRQRAGTLSGRGTQPRRGRAAARVRRRGVRHRSRRSTASPRCWSVAPVHLVTDTAAKALSDTVTPVGLVAVCTMPEADLADVLADDTATGAGRRRDLRTRQCRHPDPDRRRHGRRRGRARRPQRRPYNGKCLRASAGSIFALPVLCRARHRTASSDRTARARACRCWPPRWTARSSLESTPIWPRRRRGCSVPRRTAWPARSPRLADARVRIPMRGQRREPQRRCGRGDLPVPERAR